MSTHTAEFQFCREMEAPWMQVPLYDLLLPTQMERYIRRLYLQTSLQTSDPDLYIRLLVCCCQKEITKKPKKYFHGMIWADRQNQCRPFGDVDQPSPAQLEFSFCPWVRLMVLLFLFGI